jgi:hypothetical protein
MPETPPTNSLEALLAISAQLREIHKALTNKYEPLIRRLDAIEGKLHAIETQLKRKH